MRNKTLTTSRFAFAALFVFSAATLFYGNLFPHSTLDVVWLGYLVLMYIAAEYLLKLFRAKDIDLAFAFPLIFAVFVLNLASVWLNGQERFPLMNRAEHFASFILLTYIVWVFFVHYLPQDVWRKHQFYTAILVFSTVTAIGALNEIIELGMEFAFGTYTLGDRLDTPLDLLMNALGAAAFLGTRLIIGASKA